MTVVGDALRKAALVLEEDIRKIDAGEMQATPAQRAFLAGVVKAWKRPAAGESGGLTVDHTAGEPTDGSPSLGNKDCDGGRPENTRLAERVQLAKNPESIVAGAIMRDGSDQVTSAVVEWPDGSPGTFAVTSRDGSGNVLAYTITYGSPVTKTFTQPTITRNATGSATNVPQIVVS